MVSLHSESFLRLPDRFSLEITKFHVLVFRLLRLECFLTPEVITFTCRVTVRFHGTIRTVFARFKFIEHSDHHLRKKSRSINSIILEVKFNTTSRTIRDPDTMRIHFTI